MEITLQLSASQHVPLDLLQIILLVFASLSVPMVLMVITSSVWAHVHPATLELQLLLNYAKVSVQTILTHTMDFVMKTVVETLTKMIKLISATLHVQPICMQIPQLTVVWHIALQAITDKKQALILVFVLLPTVGAILILLTLSLETALRNVQQATGATLEIIPVIKNVRQECMDMKVAHKELVIFLWPYLDLLLCFSAIQYRAHLYQSVLKLRSSHTVTETGNSVSQYVKPTCQLHITEIPTLVNASQFASCLLSIQQILQLIYARLNVSTKHLDIITLLFV